MNKYFFEVVSTRTFTFIPTGLYLTPLYPRALEVDGVDVPGIAVRSELVQVLSEGDLTETTIKTIPLSVMNSLVDGYEFGTKLAIINPAALNAVLATFDLQLTEVGTS